MNMRDLLVFGCTGLIVGICITLVMGFVVFPAGLGGARSLAGPGLLILGLVAVVTSVSALVGGLFGGRLANEGGRGGQILMATIVGIMFALPISCIAFWYSGW